jgi:hypothetical protein
MRLMFKSCDKMHYTDPYDIYDCTNFLGFSSTICNNSLLHFREVIQCCACRQSSRTLIIDRRSSILKAFVPQKSFTLTHSIPTKCFHKHVVGFYKSFLSLKQTLIQIFCSLKSDIYAGLKNRQTTTQHYKNTKLVNAASHFNGSWHTNSHRVLLAPSSGGRPWYNWFARGIQIPRTFG